MINISKIKINIIHEGKAEQEYIDEYQEDLQ